MGVTLAPSAVPLFVPGDRPELYAKAARSGADALIIDLEDAVAPEAKQHAREKLQADNGDLPVYVRINPPGTPWHDDDVAAVIPLRFSAILVPKAEDNPGFTNLVREVGAVCPLIALIETATGLAAARQLAARPEVARLAFGSIDFSADLGCAHSAQALLLARSELVMASRLAQLPAPIDGVTAEYQDDLLAETEARHAAELGFGGKLCIHPRQIVPVLRGLQPSAAEIAWAERVVTAPSGVSTYDGLMIDDAVRQRARGLLARVGRVHAATS